MAGLTCEGGGSGQREEEEPVFTHVPYRYHRRTCKRRRENHMMSADRLALTRARFRPATFQNEHPPWPPQGGGRFVNEICMIIWEWGVAGCLS